MFKLHNTVGKRGVNIISDVKTVQILLNRHVISPSMVLNIDGIAGSKTVTAILAFQHRLGLIKCDGLVTPAGITFTALRSVPKSVPITERFFINAENMVSNSLVSLRSSAKTFTSYVKALKFSHIPASSPNAIAWGARVSPEFKERVIKISDELEVCPDYLMACMAFETCETFKSDIENKAGSKAIGLIQFMPSTAKSLGTSSEELAEMDSVKQLEYVRKFLICRKGKLKTLEDLYMAIIYPIAIGKDPDEPIFIDGDGTLKYYQNKSLDKNRDNKITPRECAAAVRAAYRKGLSKGYFG